MNVSDQSTTSNIGENLLEKMPELPVYQPDLPPPPSISQEEKIAMQQRQLFVLEKKD